MKNLLIALAIAWTPIAYGQDCSPSAINGGTIGHEGNFSLNNNVIQSIADASGSSPDIEYLWLWNPNDVPLNNGNNGWLPIEGSNSNQYAIPGLSETRYFLRCARFVGCEDYWGESNVVEIEVDPCAPSAIQGGIISFEGLYNPNTENTIDNVTPASSKVDESLDIEYIWMSSLEDKPNTVGNPYWSPIEGSENLLDLPIAGLTQTTYFIRCARVVGCDAPYWGESNTVEVPVDLCKPQFIDGGAIGFEGHYNPNQENVVHNVEAASSVFGDDVELEYIWMSSLEDKPNTVGNPYWSPIEGSENLLDLPIDGLTQTTYFIRCSRVVGCDEPYWGETNTVEVPVDLCKAQFIDGGAIGFEGPYNPNQENVVHNVEAASSDFGDDVELEYIWMSSLEDVPNTVGNPHWSPIEGSENLLDLPIDGLTQTTYFIRCSRVVGCDEPYWGETNTVEVPVDLCLPQFIDGGAIGFEGPYNPNQENVVHNVEAASSDFGDDVELEYIWMSSLEDVPNTVGNPHWSPIEGSEDLLDLPIDGLTQTTYFIRCSRVVGCDEPYWGETNTVEVPVDLCLPQFIDGGAIGFEGPYNPNQENVVHNVEAASSDFGDDVELEYIWMRSLEDVPNTVGNPHWSPIEGSEDLLDLPIDGLTQTTYFIRCARVAGCDEPYWGETNTVEVPVDLCTPEFIDGGAIGFTGTYNPNTENVILNEEEASSDFGDVELEYIWLSSLVNTPNVIGNDDWSEVDGSENQLDLLVEGLLETTYFVRCARVVGCDGPYWGESNIVEVPVDLCGPEFIDGGEIAFEGTYNPAFGNIIENIAAANSDFGDDLELEYIWLSSLINSPNVIGNDAWSEVAGSENLLELPITDISETTYFIRCARVAGCDEPYWGESNIVEVNVDFCIDDLWDGGEIEFEGDYDPTGDNIITSEGPAESEFDEIDFEYQWFFSVGEAGDTGVPLWEEIPGADGEELNIPFQLAGPTLFVRRVVVEGCDGPFEVESNIVEIDVNPCDDEFLNPGSIFFEGEYDPTDDNVIENDEAASSDFEDVEVEYRWFMSSVGDDYDWEEIPGETEEELEISDLIETTAFVRRVKADGCDGEYSVSSNIVVVDVTICNEEWYDGGIIVFEGDYDLFGDNEIESDEEATSPFDDLDFEYMWYSSADGTNWELIEDEDGEDLEVSGLTADTYFVRRIAVESCDQDYMAESNVVLIEVDVCDDDLLNGGEIDFEDEYDPEEDNEIESVEDASFEGADLELEYQWFSSPLPEGDIEPQWTAIEGADGEELEIEDLEESTLFERRVRVAGCDQPFSVASNSVLVEVEEEDDDEDEDLPEGDAGVAPSQPMSALEMTEFIIYPVPVASNEDITVEFMNEDNDVLIIRLISLNGGVAITQKNALDIGMNRITISTLGINPGTYLLEFSDGQQSVYERIFITN